MGRENVLEVLKRARDLIASPESWCKFTLAESDDSARYDKRCRVDDPTAVRFCALGAIQRAYHDLRTVGLDDEELSFLGDRARAAFRAVLPHCADFTREPIVEFNDTSTHAEVLAALDLAIEKEARS